ncbi:MAG: HD domain-containing protein [Lachnospiraceae bacterium]|nr:HD domain-containing protein [Lachnospiraceae bacterium]
MFDLIRTYQLNLMLMLCGSCIILIFLLLQTRFLSRTRKMILLFMLIVAFFLLWFDRKAYLYAGDPGRMAYVMVRVSNFMVFFLTSGIVLGFNLFLVDLLRQEGKLTAIPRRLKLTGILAVIGMLMAVVAAFTGLYYTFDASNVYHRGTGFLAAYIIPVLCPIVQFTVVRQYRKLFGKWTYISLVLYIFVPIICGLIQIKTYGISIVNMSMVAVSVSLYIFMYLDLDNTLIRAHEIEVETMKREHERMRRLFDQTATAFVSAVEKKDAFAKGNALRTANYARRVAKYAGKSDEECEQVYYAALLHDVGMIGIPDAVIKREGDPERQDYEIMRTRPMIGDEILSNIEEYPYLRLGARYSHERYNGTGYPNGLKGDEIPEIARIIAVADAYVTMTTKKHYRDAKPDFVARETFIKEAGEAFDPQFAEIMVRIIDKDSNENQKNAPLEPEEEITCRDYRQTVTVGIAAEEREKRIGFSFEPLVESGQGFAAPSLVIFDSYDARCHDDEKTIKAYHYLEYAELWFDRPGITTGARRIEETEGKAEDQDGYEILLGRCKDHIRLVLRSPGKTKEVIVALPSVSKSAYVGLTGENCRLHHINVQSTERRIAPGEIKRIIKPVSYIEHLESDLPNVQVDTWRSASTEGIEITGKVRVGVHTMSLPGADLIWHCPYLVLFTSDDGRIKGENYIEYQMIKLNGEDDGADKPCENRFTTKKEADFVGWDNWMKQNLEGMDCEVSVERRGDKVILRTTNLGLSIENITTGIEPAKKVYLALTGDLVALTDIRIL